ncbi:MAG: MarR family transcriptional regulator [Candidatus Cloacimonetes bacterium]|nr:MarR family transcriptional regulator [Candidatus Cloacimonadota bacterium]
MENLEERLMQISREVHDMFIEHDLLLRHCRKIGRMECCLLHYLFEINKPICMNDLAEHLGVSHSRITRIVDNLVKKSLVERYPSEKDRRRWFTRINIFGKQVAEIARDENLELHKKIIEALPPDKAEQIVENMKLFVEAFKKSMKTE